MIEGGLITTTLFFKVKLCIKYCRYIDQAKSISFRLRLVCYTLYRDTKMSQPETRYKAIALIKALWQTHSC